MINDSKSWSDAKSSDIFSDIENISEYNKRFTTGLLSAKRFLRKIETDLPHTSSTLRKAHGLLFDNISSWAGAPSKMQMAFGGRTGAPPQIIRDELNLADRQILDMWSRTKTTTDKLTVIAFSHARQIGIHPFTDGNGRSTREILHSNMQNLLNVQCRSFDREDYFKALKPLDQHNLAPLVKLLADHSGLKLDIPNSITAEFKIWGRQDTEKLSTDEAFRLSKNERNDFLNHQVSTQEKPWLRAIETKRNPLLDRSFEPMNLENALQVIDATFEPKGIFEKLGCGSKLADEKHRAKATILMDFIPLASPQQSKEILKLILAGDNQSVVDWLDSVDRKNPLSKAPDRDQFQPTKKASSNDLSSMFDSKKMLQELRNAKPHESDIPASKIIRKATSSSNER